MKKRQFTVVVIVGFRGKFTGGLENWKDSTEGERVLLMPSVGYRKSLLRDFGIFLSLLITALFQILSADHLL
jgi:hypothetical protein